MGTEDKKVILIVDDDDDFLLQIKIILSNNGYSVVTAYGRKEAETVLETLRPDCACIDLMKEEKDGGFVLSHHLKNRYPDVPVLLLTAVTAETGISFGVVSAAEKEWIKADVILPKPVRPEQLLHEIKKVVA